MSSPNDVIDHCIQEVVGVTLCAPTHIFFCPSQIKKSIKVCGYNAHLDHSGVNDLSWPLNDLWVGVTCVFKSWYPFVQLKIHQSMWIQWLLMHILTIWGQWPQINHRWSLSLFCLGHRCAPTQISFSKSSMKIYQSVWEQWAILLGLTFLAHTPPIHTRCYAHFLVPLFPRLFPCEWGQKSIFLNWM